MTFPQSVGTEHLSTLTSGKSNEGVVSSSSSFIISDVLSDPIVLLIISPYTAQQQPYREYERIQVCVPYIS